MFLTVIYIRRNLVHSYTYGVFSGWRMPNHNFSSESNEPDHLLIFSINIMNTIRNNKRVSMLDVNSPRKHFWSGFRPFYFCRSIRKNSQMIWPKVPESKLSLLASNLFIYCVIGPTTVDVVGEFEEIILDKTLPERGNGKNMVQLEKLPLLCQKTILSIFFAFLILMKFKRIALH